MDHPTGSFNESMIRCRPSVRASSLKALFSATSSRRRLTIVCAAMCACSPTQPSDFLDASLRPEVDAVASGASGLVRVEVINRGSREIEIEIVTCPPRILVYDRLGNRVGQPTTSCPLSLTGPVVLAPGETHVHAQGWFASDADGTPLPPGTYRLQAWVVPVGGDLVLTDRVSVSVRAHS